VSVAIMKQLQPIVDSLPAGYRIDMAGSIEESGKATQAMLPLFPIMIALTLLIIILQVRSLSAMVMVFLTAPLGLIGVVPTLLIFNQPFGINALVGLIALSGILMRNTLILIGQIDHNQKDGLDPFQAVVEATVQRARPGLLTAMAAVLAFIPLTHSVFWGTLAWTLIGGTLGGTIITLVFLPAMYAIWFRIRPVEQRVQPRQKTCKLPSVDNCSEASMVVKRLRKEDRRVQLLEVARGIVRQQGTEALTLGYLAERANVTKPIPYDHFGDREGLLMALYQDYSDRQLAKFRETLAVDSKTLEKTIRFFSAAYIDCAMPPGLKPGPLRRCPVLARCSRFVRRAWPNAPTACVPRFPLCRPERRSGRSGTDGHHWCGGRAQHRRGQRRARPKCCGRYAQRRHHRVLETYVNSTK
jgi:hypothetical protein